METQAAQKKTTAFASSAPTDERQLPNRLNEFSIASPAAKHNPSNPENLPLPLQTMDGHALLLADLPPIRFVMEDLLPQGLFILAGSPKVGKSCLSLMLAQQVAVGGALLGRKVERGTVLYLALEDSLNRLQSRYRRYAEDGSPSLHFAIRAQLLKDGLVAQVEQFILCHPDTALVIIDTMQQVRGSATDKNCYVNDYNDMNTLREIISQHDIALLLVTHTRKLDDHDPLLRVSGSTGLAGAVDGVFVLEKDARTSAKGRLTAMIRDTGDHVLLLEFRAESCRWELLEEQITESTEDPLFPPLAVLLTNTEAWTGTATGLCAAINAQSTDNAYTPATIAKALHKHEQVLFNRHGISVEHRTRDNVKTITLSRRAIR